MENSLRFLQTFNKSGIRAWQASTHPSQSHIYPAPLLEWKNVCLLRKKRGEKGREFEGRKSVLPDFHRTSKWCLSLSRLLIKLYYSSLNTLRTSGWKDFPNSISLEPGKNKRAFPREREWDKHMMGGDVRGVETDPTRDSAYCFNTEQDIYYTFTP